MGDEGDEGSKGGEGRERGRWDRRACGGRDTRGIQVWGEETPWIIPPNKLFEKSLYSIFINNSMNENPPKPLAPATPFQKGWNVDLFSQSGNAHGTSHHLKAKGKRLRKALRTEGEG